VSNASNVAALQRQYARMARWYPLLMRPFAPIRAQAIARLGLVLGDTVLELGCGTGTGFAQLVDLVGPRGAVIGIDRSAAMLRYAQRLADESGWCNVRLLVADATRLTLPHSSVDAIMVFYANDILMSPAAIDGAIAALRPGGRIVIAGAKLTDRLHGTLVNPITRAYAAGSIATPLSTAPWQALAERLQPLVVEEHLLGTSFIAWGRVPSR
jgi:phosphatidylethanolamine/phosphatidyl-N-methylethanolamine N-methyltransferase